MRLFTLTLAMPNSNRNVAITLAECHAKSIIKSAAAAIRSFAASRGVSPLLVDYSLTPASCGA